MRPNHLLRHGFTLIELLVVISIIALLIAILLPSLQNARASGRNVVCLSNHRQMMIASSVYAADNNDVLIQNIAPSDPTQRGNPYWHYSSWHTLMAEALADTNHPDTADRWGDTYPNLIQKVATMWCPEAGPFDGVDGASYGPVAKEGPNGSFAPERARLNDGWKPLIVDNIDATPSNVLYAGDANGWGIRSGGYTGPFGDPMFRHQNSEPLTELRQSSGGSRGNGSANMVFADGHAESIDETRYFAESGNATTDKIILWRGN